MKGIVKNGIVRFLTRRHAARYCGGMADKYFIEVRLRSAVDPGEMVLLLEDQGVLGCWEEDGILRLYWDQERWHATVERRVREVLENLGERMSAAELEVSRVPDRDWNAAWIASLHPIRLGRRIRIRQSWHPPDSGFDGVELVIDPGRAFGSGYHATTQMVIEWMEERIRPGDTVLDIGTGSGILAMVALRLGAASVSGIDNDPVAIGCARELAAANGFGPEFDLRAVSFEDLGPGAFDVVLANLDIRNLPSLCAHLPRLMIEEGRACLSGLLNEDCEEIAGFLERARMFVSARMERDGWTALEVRRADRLGDSRPFSASLDP